MSAPSVRRTGPPSTDRSCGKSRINPRSPRGRAQEYGVSHQFLRNAIHAGELKAVDVRGPGSSLPRYLILDEHIQEFMRARLVSPEA
jgi:hypothetical protein